MKMKDKIEASAYVNRITPPKAGNANLINRGLAVGEFARPTFGKWNRTQPMHDSGSGSRYSTTALKKKK